MKIFPINLKKKTWKNYSNYLYWLDNDIQSIKDYLQVFNPDFFIINESLNTIQSKNWSDNKTTPFDDDEINNYYDKGEFLANKLKFREGYYADSLKTVLLPDDTKVLLQPSQIIFSLRKNPTDLSSYLIMSQPFAAVYLPQNIENGLKYTFVENGQTAVGTNILFSLEFFPTRYFLTDLKDTKWGQNNIGWNAQGAYWSNINDNNPSIKICNGNKNRLHRCKIQGQRQVEAAYHRRHTPRDNPSCGGHQ